MYYKEFVYYFSTRRLATAIACRKISLSALDRKTSFLLKVSPDTKNYINRFNRVESESKYVIFIFHMVYT